MGSKRESALVLRCGVLQIRLLSGAITLGLGWSSKGTIEYFVQSGFICAILRTNQLSVISYDVTSYKCEASDLG